MNYEGGEFATALGTEYVNKSLFKASKHNC